MNLRCWLAQRRQAQGRGPRLWQAGRREVQRERREQGQQGLALPQANPLAVRRVRRVRPLAPGLQLVLVLALQPALALQPVLVRGQQPALALHLKLGLALALQPALGLQPALQPEPALALHLKLGPALGLGLRQQPGLEPALQPGRELQPALGLVQAQVRERQLEQQQERVQVVVQSSLWGRPTARY